MKGTTDELIERLERAAERRGMKFYENDHFWLVVLPTMLAGTLFFVAVLLDWLA